MPEISRTASVNRQSRRSGANSFVNPICFCTVKTPAASTDNRLRRWRWQQRFFSDEYTRDPLIAGINYPTRGNETIGMILSEGPGGLRRSRRQSMNHGKSIPGLHRRYFSVSLSFCLLQSPLQNTSRTIYVFV